MVLVDAADLQEPPGHTLVAQPELVGHPAARRVARDDRRLDAVQPELLERVPEHQHDALGDVAVPGRGLVDPVADVRRLERPALHVAEAHLTGEALAVAEEHPEAVRRVELALAVPRAAPGPERIRVGRRVGAPGLGAAAPTPPASPGCGPAPRATRRSPTRNGRSSTRGPSRHGASRWALIGRP